MLPSNYEGMPNSLMEAMALKMACVSTDCEIGGPRALIKNKSNGILVETNNVKAMSDAIIYLIENPDQRAKFSNNNAHLFKQLSEKNIADEWVSFIRKIINSKED